MAGCPPSPNPKDAPTDEQERSSSGPRVVLAVLAGVITAVATFALCASVAATIAVRHNLDSETLAYRFGELLEFWFLISMAITIVLAGAVAGYLAAPRYLASASITGLLFTALFVLANVVASEFPYSPRRIAIYLVMFWSTIVGGYLGARVKCGKRKPDA